MEFEENMKAQIAANEKQTRKHLRFLEKNKQKNLDIKLQEYSNYLVSMFNNQNMTAEEEENPGI